MWNKRFFDLSFFKKKKLEHEVIEKMTLIPINLPNFIPKEHNKRLVMTQPPNSSRNPKVGPKVKQRKQKRVGAHSLTHNK
jgi:hypothetical protein